MKKTGDTIEAWMPVANASIKVLQIDKDIK
jgi:hypothetical protein